MRNWLKYVFGESQVESSWMLTRCPDGKAEGVSHLTFAAMGTTSEMAALEAKIKTVIGGSDER